MICVNPTVCLLRGTDYELKHQFQKVLQLAHVVTVRKFSEIPFADKDLTLGALDQIQKMTY